MMKPLACCVALVSVIIALPAVGQTPTIHLDQIECVPVGGNAIARATVGKDVPGTEVRLYFRRLNDVVEDFYWVEMEASGRGTYWAPLPKPSDAPPQRHELELSDERLEVLWAAWWSAKELSDHRNPNRDLDQLLIEERSAEGRKLERRWMTRMDVEGLQLWLEEQDYEPVEYYGAVYDPYGVLVARSAIGVTEVRTDCPVLLTRREQSLASNLTIGETAPWQRGEAVFHWLCDGVVTRVDPEGNYRGDEICRACVVAWSALNEVLAPAALGGGGVITVVTDEPPDVSPSSP